MAHADEIPDRNPLQQVLRKLGNKVLCWRGRRSPPLDPLVASFQHNLAQSSLYRLPDNLLITIVSSLDQCSVECLRRAGRLFLRICPLANPTNFRTVGTRLQAAPWAVPVRFSEDYLWEPQVQKDILELLERDKYCFDCWKARECHDWDERARKVLRTYLHCSKCRLDHPSCLFSKRQRSVPYNDARFCIGHEGSLRLCSHAAIKWSQVTLSSFPESGLNRKGDELLRCHHKSHRTSCRAFPWSDRDMGNATKPVIWGTSTPWGRHYIQLEWHGHLNLATMDARPFTAQILRHRLEELRQRGGDFVCPVIKPGHLIELHRFDPNRCNCIEYEGSQGVDWRLANPPKPPFPAPGVHVTGWCRAFQKNQPKERRGRHHEQRRNMRRIRQRHGGMRNYVKLSQEPSSLGVQWASFSMKRCERSLSGLDVGYSRVLGLYEDEYSRTKMSPHWFQALDPDSYGLTDDGEGYGVFWCQQEQCANYYKYPLSRTLQNGDYNRGCSCRSDEYQLDGW